MGWADNEEKEDAGRKLVLWRTEQGRGSVLLGAGQGCDAHRLLRRSPETQRSGEQSQGSKDRATQVPVMTVLSTGPGKQGMCGHVKAQSDPPVAALELAKGTVERGEALRV